MLPKEYTWLDAEPGPKMLREALALYGVKEKAGPADNPIILAWADECGIEGYNADSIPWCGLFIAVVAKRAGKDIAKKPLWARDWALWGEKSLTAELGDVLVFQRPGGGHVGLYVGEDASRYFVLGGNQADQVSIVPILKARCIAVRRSYSVGPPANVRRIILKNGAPSSVNEA